MSVYIIGCNVGIGNISRLLGIMFISETRTVGNCQTSNNILNQKTQPFHLLLKRLNISLRLLNIKLKFSIFLHKLKCLLLIINLNGVHVQLFPRILFIMARLLVIVMLIVVLVLRNLLILELVLLLQVLFSMVFLLGTAFGSGCEVVGLEMIRPGCFDMGIAIVSIVIGIVITIINIILITIIIIPIVIQFLLIKRLKLLRQYRIHPCIPLLSNPITITIIITIIITITAHIPLMIPIPITTITITQITRLIITHTRIAIILIIYILTVPHVETVLVCCVLAAHLFIINKYYLLYAKMQYFLYFIYMGFIFIFLTRFGRYFRYLYYY